MKAPKIRFKGFEGDWDIKNLWNNSKISTWTCVTDKETSDNYKYPVISGWKDIMWYYFEYNRKPNTITIARAWTAWFVQLIKSPFYLNDKCFSVISNNEIFNTNFLFFSLKNSEKNIMNLRSSTSVPTINTQHLNSLQISLPSLPEQEKIWSLFEQIDSHISKNQQKLEKLKNMKQSFLQKLFPKDWSALPELRFKGFEGAWEERKLGEICQITMWQSPDWSTYSNKKSDYILVQWNSDLKNWRVVPRIRTTQKTKTANVGDLIMSVRAPAWAIWKTGYDIVLWRWVASIKGNDFVFYFLVKLDTFWYWKRLSAWSTFDSINSDSIQNLNIYFPSLPEQKKIWAFFEKLDTQITHQSQKIQKLQNIKQSLLEKMFI